MATVEEVLGKLEGDLSIAGILEMQNRAQSMEELNAITEIGMQIADDRLTEAVAGFKARTRRFLNVTEKMLKAIDRLDDTFVSISPKRVPSAAPVLSELIDRLSEALRLFHDDEGMRTTHTSNQQVEDIDNDEEEIPPAPEPVVLPPQPAPPADKILHAPTPLDSRQFEELADEYVRFFEGAGYKNDRKPLVKKYANEAVAHRSRYEAVGDPLGIPWWFIAGIHLLESSYNFKTHLHNGDPLTARTFRVPSGRPKTGSPPFSWEVSARDALRHHELANLSDWSLPRALWRWERYNGWGYRSRLVPSPYLWSFSSIYEKGKYVGDGVFDRNAVSKQCGCATFLRYLFETGQAALDLDVVGEDETNQSDPDGDAKTVVDNGQPNIDNTVPPDHPFQAFFEAKLPGVQNFAYHEFLVKGGSNKTLKLNTDPPERLWANILPLVPVLDRLRTDIGVPVVLTSVYRSPAYNAKIGGASRSQHMAFTAADLKVVGAGAGSTGDWANRIRQYRQSGMFEGGVGLYRTFVHVDVRGTRADWDNR